MNNPRNLPPGVTDRMIEEQAGAFDEIKCHRCGKLVPVDDVVRVERKPHCIDCADNFLDSFGEGDNQ